MVTFGRRLPAAQHRVPDRAPAPVQDRATSGDLGGVFRSVGVLLLVLLSTAHFYWQLTNRDWLETSPWDRTPGMTFDIGPFAAPEGCEPVKRTSGEYFPRKCVVGRGFTDPNRIGLVDPPDWRHAPVNYVWIDSGPDALLVACVLWAPCKVVVVAEQRFSGREPAGIRAPAVEAAAHRMPLHYILALSAEIGGSAMMVAFMIWAVFASISRAARSRNSA